ncbi:MAG: TonB-dependent receptor [Bacteroidetes bacterium]|nr:TonB-dependent receptor [Bacteroidota bacterium]
MSSNKFLWAFLSIFFFTTISINAQQAFVNGSVRDSANGEALVGVVVRIPSGAGTVTDINGAYSLTVPVGKVKLKFNYSGYRADSAVFNTEEGKTIHFDLKMISTSKQLSIFVVSSGRYEQNIGEVPVSCEVLRPKLIENKCTTNMENIMDQVPGVSMTDGQANIRGGSGYSFGAGSRVMMVVDDMPMLSGDASDVKWNYLPLENVSQVEVMKGASSTLFGSSAMNGVIHFRTAYPTDKPATTITMFSGFYGEPQRPELKWWHNSNPTFSGTNFSHSQQIGNLDLVLGGHVYSDEGYRYLEREQRERFNMNLRYRFKKVPGLNAGINTNMMNTRGGLFLLWYNDTLAYTPSDSTIQNYSNNRFNIDPYINYFSPNGSRHSIRTRFYRTNNHNDTKQAAIADFYYGEYQFQHRFKNTFTITTGLVGTYTKVHSDLYKDHLANNVSGYAQFDRKFFDRLFITVGVRAEYFKDDSLSTEYSMRLKKSDTLMTLPFRPVVRAGITYQAGEGTFFRISYGQGYRFPAIAEKYIRTSAAGLEIYPNHGLQPESGQSAEIGVKQGIHIGKAWKGYADVALFWMQYTNMMEFTFGLYGRPTDPNWGLGFESINIGSTRIRGVDCSVMGEGKIGKVDVMLLAGYTYMDPVSLRWNPAHDTLFATSNQNILKYRYRHIGKFDAEATYKKFSFGASMRCNSRMENIDKFFEQALPGIKAYRQRFHTGDVVFDTRIMYQLTDRARISFIVNNVLNREYTSRPADVQPPRNFVFQVMLKF